MDPEESAKQAFFVKLSSRVHKASRGYRALGLCGFRAEVSQRFRVAGSEGLRKLRVREGICRGSDSWSESASIPRSGVVERYDGTRPRARVPFGLVQRNTNGLSPGGMRIIKSCFNIRQVLGIFSLVFPHIRAQKSSVYEYAREAVSRGFRGAFSSYGPGSRFGGAGLGLEVIGLELGVWRNWGLDSAIVFQWWFGAFTTVSGLGLSRLIALVV